MAAILVATALEYCPSLSNQFILDERAIVVNNRYIANWSYLWKSLVNDEWWFFDPAHTPVGSYYRPLTSIWFWLNFHLFGLHPMGWCAAMIAMHLIAVWLVFRVASSLSDDALTGLFTATLFALMPVHTEAVAGSFASLLCSAFELGAFQNSLTGSRRIWPLILYACALLTYESALVFPLLIATHALLFPSGNNAGEPEPAYADRIQGAIIKFWPYALEAAAYVALRMSILGFFMRNEASEPNSPTTLQALLTIPSAVSSYGWLLIEPWDAGPAHRLTFASGITAQEFFLPTLGLLVLGYAIFTVLRRHPHRNLYLFCGAWFFITIAPTLNLGGLFAQSIIQDRYLYMPSFAFCLIAADLSVTWGRTDDIRMRTVGIAATALIFVYTVSLVQVQKYWHDDVAVFTQCTQQDPSVMRCHYRLGVALAEQGDYAEARGELETAHYLSPEDGSVLYDLGLADGHLGDRTAAAREIAEGISRIKYPTIEQYTQLALAADAAGDTKSADAALAQAKTLSDGANVAGVLRAQLLFRHGDAKGAETALRELLERDQTNAEALKVLGAIMSSEHRYDDALGFYRRAVAASPSDSTLHYLTALALHHLGRDREALDECAMVLSGTPNNPGARALMAEINRTTAATP